MNPRVKYVLVSPGQKGIVCKTIGNKLTYNSYLRIVWFFRCMPQNISDCVTKWGNNTYI